MSIIPDVCVFGNDINGEYHTITVNGNGKCYYFQTNGLDYVSAVDNCKTKFYGRGKLFEPRSKKENDAVVSVAQDISPNKPHWIGIRTQPHDAHREFYYLRYTTIKK